LPKLILSLLAVVLLVAFMLLTSIGRGLFLVIRVVAIVAYEKCTEIPEAWSQRSGGRAARAERIEIPTVSA
jgi:hypothetical protein